MEGRGILTPKAIADALAGDCKPKRTSTGWLTLCPVHEDRNPSLSVSEGKDGGILVHCFGGCAQKAVVDELKARNLWPSSNGERPQAKGKARRKLVATYDYRDAAGATVYQVCRFEPKDFRQRRPDPKNPEKWLWNLDGMIRLPYRLPELLAADPTAPVFIDEGEKDADRLAALGLVATCNSEGACKWRSELNQFFKGRRVVILSDNDAPGREHALKVAQALYGIAASAKVLHLPGLPPKGDVSDWLAAGGSVENLLELAEAAPDWKPQANPKDAYPPHEKGQGKQTPIITGFNLTDLGNAQRLVARHGQDLRYCYPWGRWLVWDGRRWIKDESGEVDRRAKDTVRGIYGEAAAIDEKNLREAVADHARKSESDSKRQAMMNSARSEPGIAILPVDLDRDQWLLNVLNGTLDLRKGELLPHFRKHLITKLAPVNYDPESECPTWWKFLFRIMGDNLDLIFFLQKTVGYALTGDIREQCLFFLYGLGANGKSTFIEILQALLGDYASQATGETFMVKRQNNSVPNDVADLRGARFVSAVEIESGRRISEVLIKQMTGNDKLKARFLYSEHFEFRPEFKIFLAGNHKPVIRGTDHAIWRRIRLIPFTIQIPEAEQDKELSEKLKAELPGILNWALEGCISWQHEGLTPPQAVQNATQNYRQEMDTLVEFLAERCITAPGASVYATDLYRAYTAWAEENGEKRPFNQREFGMNLTERGFEGKRGTGGRTVRHGIGLRAE